MARRLPSPPPVLPGFTHLHIVGTGGFADVYLYEQNLPKRPVAVKVMLADMVDEAVRSRFRSEVDLMGRLSSHPNILTVYSASVSADGRPYIVMELCSAIIGARFRESPYAVDEALDVMIRIGSAIETAHRAGTLHRDIKPANIMTTVYGHPVLSDFGIAGNSGDNAALGVSVPWSAPEVLLDESSGSVASEVWAFGATLYSLLAGRSPAEIPGRLNGTVQLVQRITQHQLEPMGRDDVPESLARIIDKSMSRKSADRYSGVLAMLLELQEVQEELEVPVTPIEVEMDTWTSMRPELEHDTIGDLDAALLPVRTGRARRISAMQLGERVDISSTTERAAPEPPKRRRMVTGLGIALAAVVVAGVIAAAGIAFSNLLGGIPDVGSVTAEGSSDGVEFTWSDPGLLDTDSYIVRTSAGDALIQRATSFSMAGEPGEELCVTVAVNRDGSTGDEQTACAEVEE